MSSGISSSDRLRGQTCNPPSHSQRRTVQPREVQASVRDARARLGFLLWRHRLDWAPNPVCCGAADEGPVAVATRPRCPYSPAAAGGGEHSKGRAGRWARSRIWSPSCCSSLPWSTPSDKTSYSVALWQQHLYRQENVLLKYRSLICSKKSQYRNTIQSYLRLVNVSNPTNRRAENMWLLYI